MGHWITSGLVDLRAPGAVADAKYHFQRTAPSWHNWPWAALRDGVIVGDHVGRANLLMMVLDDAFQQAREERPAAIGLRASALQVNGRTMLIVARRHDVPD